MSEEVKGSVGLCSGCLGKSRGEHVCSSQIFSDSFSSLGELAEEQLSLFKHFSLEKILRQGERQLQEWHQAAQEHLLQIFNERREDLRRTFNAHLQGQLNQSRENILQQIKEQFFPPVHRFIEHKSNDPNKIQLSQSYLSLFAEDCQNLLSSRCLTVELPELKNFSIPIRIAKMPLPATLTERTDKDNDPLQLLDDEEEQTEELKKDKENDQQREKKKKKDPFDLMKIFTLSHPPTTIFPLESNSSTLAFSSTHLLLHDQKKLILFTIKNKIIELNWDDNQAGILVDMCWMSSICLFLLLTIDSVYSFDPLKCSSQGPVKIDSIRPLDRTHVLASLCPFDRDLFINYHKGVHLDHYRIEGTSNWILQKRFDKCQLAEKNDLGCRDVRSNGQHLCLSFLQGDDFKWRLDLFSRDLVRLRRGVPMDAAENQHKFFSMLTHLNEQRWAFVNWFTNQLWIVDQQGKTRWAKETKIKNIRNLAIDNEHKHLAIRTDKPSQIQIFLLE